MRRIVHAVRRPHAAGAGLGIARSRPSRLLAPAVALALTAMCAGVPVVSADTIGSGAGGATASSEVVVERGHRGPAVRSIQRKLGIQADGVFGPQTERAVRRFQRRNGLVTDGIVGPITRGALGLEPFSRSSERRGRRTVTVPRILRLIAECESGGSPRAVSPGGQYRGKYQFSIPTWRGLGGTGDPADAPEWRQDQLALKLYRQSGTAPWPNCP